MLDNAHRCAPVRSVTKTVQRRRCTRSPSAHARSRATIGVETLARAPHALPRESCKREEKKAREKESESGERCTVVMSLRAAALLPLTNPTGDARDREAWEISGISNVSKVGTFSSVPEGFS